MEWLAHGIGFVGTGAAILSYQCKSSKNLILLQVVGYLLFVVHYYMLGAVTGAISQLLGGIYGLLVTFRGAGWTGWRGWKWVFSLAYGLGALMTWQGPTSLLALAASVSTTMALWSRSGKLIRLSRLCVAGPGWIIYGICHRSYAGILCECFSIASVLLSIYRFGWDRIDKEQPVSAAE